MATLRIPLENRAITEAEEVRAYLAGIGIAYERWEPSHEISANAPAADQRSDAAPRPAPPLEQQNRDNFGAGIFPEI